MPPAKKRKTSPESAEPSVGDLRQQAQDLVGKLGETIDAMEASDPKKSLSLITDASLRLMDLKALQRRVLDQIHQSQSKLEEQRKTREAQELQLQNLKYQKVLNDHAIEASQNPVMSQLVQLCRSELEEEEKTSEDDQAVLQRFFQADTKDPVQRAVIMDKLNQQIRIRTKLEAKWKQCQQQASALKQSLASKRTLLQSLPSKLQEMERTSIPLQKFCQKSLKATKLLGTTRRTNLDLAHALPKALYTLFYMLQSSLDSMEASGELDALEKASAAPSLQVNQESTQVVLNIPIPTISDRTATTTTVVASGFGSGKKIAVITFEHDEAANIVTAASSQDHDMGKLLAELFPGDTGDQLLSKTSGNDDAADSTEQAMSPSDGGGRPYNWCNYLAGHHLAPSEKVSQPNMHQSATVVIRALLRRVRAQATLSWILHALSRKPHPLPVHPALKDASFCQNKDTSSTKLVSWTEDSSSSNDDPSQDFFLATLKRRSSILSLRVGVYSARYPSIPPTWEFNPEQQSGGGADNEASLDEEKTVLYDEQLSSLERRINQNVQDLVSPTDETTYEWILAHQLSEIATKWEEQLVESESSS